MKPKTAKRYYTYGSVSGVRETRPRAPNVPCGTDTKTFNDARAGIPVTIQRRFDVYPDVSNGL